MGPQHLVTIFVMHTDIPNIKPLQNIKVLLLYSLKPLRQLYESPANGSWIDSRYMLNLSSPREVYSRKQMVNLVICSMSDCLQFNQTSLNCFPKLCSIVPSKRTSWVDGSAHSNQNRILSEPHSAIIFCCSNISLHNVCSMYEWVTALCPWLSFSSVWVMFES